MKLSETILRQYDALSSEACGTSGPVCNTGPKEERAERALIVWNKMSQNCGAT